jgi:hypothetical protein
MFSSSDPVSFELFAWPLGEPIGHYRLSAILSSRVAKPVLWVPLRVSKNGAPNA